MQFKRQERSQGHSKNHKRVEDDFRSLILFGRAAEAGKENDLNRVDINVDDDDQNIARGHRQDRFLIRINLENLTTEENCDQDDDGLEHHGNDRNRSTIRKCKISFPFTEKFSNE